MSDDDVILDSNFNRRLKNIRSTNSKLPSHPAPAQPKQQAFSNQTLYGFPKQQPQDYYPSQSVSQKSDSGDRIWLNDEIIPDIFSFKYVMRQLKIEVRRAEKFNRTLAVMMVRFPDLNNLLEHTNVEVLNRASIEIASKLPQFVEMGIDVIGRYSKDKFVIVLPEQQGAYATNTAEAIRQYFEKNTIHFQDYNLIFKASIAISCYPQHGSDWKTLVAKADLTSDMLTERGGNAFGFSPTG